MPGLLIYRHANARDVSPDPGEHPHAPVVSIPKAVSWKQWQMSPRHLRTRSAKSIRQLVASETFPFGKIRSAFGCASSLPAGINATPFDDDLVATSPRGRNA